MSDFPAFGGEEFFSNMLGDLLRLMPAGGGSQWPFAYQVAASSAAGDADDPNPDPRERIRLEELSAVAELHVSDLTGMTIAPGQASPHLVASSRSEWSRRTLELWRPVLERIAPTASGATEPGATGDDIVAAGDSPDRLAELLGKWASAMTPMMLALQVGSAAGHLAQRALGQYELPLAPIAGSEILVVAGNLSKTAEDWSLPVDDLSLWLCVHELVMHAVLSRPHVAERLASLVVAHAERVRPDLSVLQRLVSDGDVNDPEAMMAAFGDSAALSAEDDDGELDRLRSQLDTLSAAIAGYADHATAAVADRLIGNHAPIGEAMRRRRVGRGEGEKTAERLFGLRLDQEQVDRGRRFVEGVLERSGDAKLARLWIDEPSLPTPAELDAPGLWIARLDLNLP